MKGIIDVNDSIYYNSFILNMKKIKVESERFAKGLTLRQCQIQDLDPWSSDFKASSFSSHL